MTDKLADSYPMPAEESDNTSLSSGIQDVELPPFHNITEEDIFEHDIDAALFQEIQNNGLDYDENNLPEREYIQMPTIFEPIPEEAQKEILSKFALKKREKESTVTKTAQRLVNQFRALSAFRDDYVAEYNEELLNTSEEVLSYLPTIIGGPAVREYLDYILAHKQQGKVFDQENIDFSITKRHGYLPSPDEDEPYQISQKEISSNNISVDQTPLIQQTQLLSETLSALKNSLTEQSNELKSAIALMGEALNRPVHINSDAVVPIQSVETTEQTSQNLQMQREMMENAFEKMISMQSELFQKTIEELSKTVQTMQEQLRPTGVVRQALSSLKAAQSPTKEETESTNQPQTEKKPNKKVNKKEKEESVTKEVSANNNNTANEKEILLNNTPPSNNKENEQEVSLNTETSEKTPSQKKEATPKKEEKKFSLLDELGLNDDFDTYDEINKNKRYSLLDELEDDEMEILSEFDISKHD